VGNPGHVLGSPLTDRLTDDVPLPELPCTADEVRVHGEPASSRPHENAPDAVVDTCAVDGGRLLLSLPPPSPATGRAAPASRGRTLHVLSELAFEQYGAVAAEAV
jgi:hypothetical protein